ncbi:hypothetical protein PIB30_078423 [Stylosanthes scabra]|uniref:Uncharacterized protein n=1 Tax=Stylosanthes scabra TaxID=79078 RepID=A0ABU6RRQ8_9FABA|nr:hypothetical protein [Stylosanthes scabra]
MKKKVKIRNQGKESSKEESEEKKAKRRIELKCNSVEDLMGKFLTFKKVLHNNDAMSNHLVKDQSKWKSLARLPPPGGVAARSENAILLATGATAPLRPHASRARTMALARLCVSLARFGRSYQVAWRRHAPSWRDRTVRVAQWPWWVRALALGPLGKGPGRAARS